MKIQEAAGLFGFSVEKVKSLISHGLQLPKSKDLVKLEASAVGSSYDIKDEQFDDFVARFEAEEPGRHPPSAIRRALLIEARHHCAICRQAAPPQFHHMLDWSKLKHHDPKHMLAICGTCHTRCTNGEIDYKSQVEYKAKLLKALPTGLPFDPQQATKRNADIETITRLYSVLPRPIVDRVLRGAMEDHIYVGHVDVLQAAAQELESSNFHLYDKELWRLIRDFLSLWADAISMGSSLYHDNNHMGVATLILDDLSPASQWEMHEDFQRHIAQAHHTFAILNCYLREQFPEFDVNASDRESLKKYKEMIHSVEQRTAEMLDRLDDKSDQ